jgi:predicted O-methyltransferase YrrM
MENRYLRAAAEVFLRLADPVLALLLIPGALLMKFARRVGVHRVPVSRRLFQILGVFPLRAHYYEPRFDYREIPRRLSEERPLPGIDWRLGAQLELLEKLRFGAELGSLPRYRTREREYYLDNRYFEAGDAEFLYQVIRLFKPRRIIEIGSGHSTLMALRAVEANRRIDPAAQCELTCVEPHESHWLEQLGVKVVREQVEDIDPAIFAELGENDLLFIDSSHVVRPHGDVLHNILAILPTLKPGVIVHFHDIFSPADYPWKWVVDEIRFWGEQYVLEAFLCNNREWEVMAALNQLWRHHFDALKRVSPYLEADSAPCSFYLRKIA